jgi:predicted MFS family arabinose efflux permease
MLSSPRKSNMTANCQSLVFTPSVTLLAQYFQKKRGLAIGIAAAGAASGGMVYPAIVETCLYHIGFPWTVRIMGFVMLVTQALCVLGLKPRLGPRRAGPIVEWSAFKELPYALYAIGSFLLFWGLYFAFFYIGKFGRNILGLSQSSSINLLIVLNGIGFFARIIPGYLADRWTGPVTMYIIFAFSASLIIFCWAFVDSQSGLTGFSITYGIFAGGIQSLFPSSLSTLTTDLKKAGVRLGMVFSVVSFAALTGPPLAGALIQQNDGKYLYAQMWAGTSMMAGFLTLVAARIAKAGWKPFLKV